MKALVGAFNQEKALVGAFSVNVQPVVEPMDRFVALVTTYRHDVQVRAAEPRVRHPDDDVIRVEDLGLGHLLQTQLPLGGVTLQRSHGEDLSKV